MIEPCRACGAQNHIPTERLHERARCGTCMRPIVPLAAPHAVHSEAEFDDFVGHSPLPVVVDFWAPALESAGAVAHEIEKLARSKAGGAVVLELNIEELPHVAERYGVRSNPTFILFRDGQESKRLTGVHPASELMTAFAG